MRLHLPFSNPNKLRSKSRGYYSTLNQTPNLTQFSQSRFAYSRNKTFSSSDAFKQTLKYKLNDIISGTSHSIPLKILSRPNPVYSVPDKDYDQVIIKQKLQEIKEDKLIHLLYKNRIKKKFMRNKNKAEDRTLNNSPESQYSITQHQVLHQKPRYNYLELNSTFYSKSKRRVFDEDLKQPEIKDYCTRPITEKMKNQSANYLRYISDRKHRIKFREARRCKTEGLIKEEESKQQIVKIIKKDRKGSRQFTKTLNNFLQDQQNRK